MYKVAFFTLGCKVNQYESYALMAAFESGGFEIVSPAGPADVYIVNSCTVTSTGDKKSLQALRRFRRQSPGAVIVFCGCYPQAFPEKAAGIADADIIMGSRKKAALLDAVKQKLGDRGRARQVEILPHQAGDLFEAMSPPLFAGRTRAYLKIQDGCEQRCSYCIIPDARGSIRSKPMPALKEELRILSGAGYREVVLVGINLSCYGKDLGLTLTDAIAASQETEGIERVRLGSLEPENLDQSIISEWPHFSKLCPQFHLSLQSGCDRTLSRMRRQYDAAAYRKIVSGLRGRFPGCVVTTDLMVAFPGETEQDHLESKTFVQEIGFARAHVFVYSPRAGTPAAGMPEKIPATVGKERAKEMALLAKASEEAFLSAQAGQVCGVLCEKKSGNLWQGYTPNYTMVRFEAEGDLAGKVVPVLLETAQGDYCRGRLAPR